MWKFENIANSSTAELLLSTERSPRTLYEIHQLAELARRAARGETPLDEVVRRVIASCRDDENVFGAPAGYLAAGVLAGAPDPVASAFWHEADKGLDARSLATLRSQFRDAGASPPLPDDPEKAAPGGREQWIVSVFGAADESVVVRAVRLVAATASLVEQLSESDPSAWIFEVPAGPDAHISLNIAFELANATGAPASCDIPAALGALGPDIVAFCRPGGEPALGTLHGDTADSQIFTPIDHDTR